MITAFFIFILSLIYIARALILYFKNSKKLPPGPIRWPIIGNLIELNLADPEYPHLAFAKLAKKYGEIMSIGYGSHYAVIVSSHEAMKEIFRRDETAFARFEFPYVKERSLQKNLGIIWSNGPSWRDMRRYTMKTLRDFGYGKAKSMEVVMKTETHDIVAYIQSTIQANDGILDVNMHRFAANAVNIIWSLAGGYRFSPDDENLQLAIKLGEETVDIIGHRTLYNALPFVKDLFPKWSHWERHGGTHVRMAEYIRELIAEVKERRLERANSQAECFTEAFLDEIERERENPESYFTEDQLIVILMDLFLAGSETTSTTLNWAILFLTLNPKIQTKLQKEICTISNGTIDNIRVKDLERMPYMKATMLEIFRLSNLVPVPIPRCPTSDFQYGPYTIPKGTCLFFNLECVFQDEKFWGDPKTFRPERFLNDEGTAVNKDLAERITIFGFGKRLCLAETLAWDSLFMYITYIFGNFTFEPIPGNEPSPDKPVAALTILPRNFSAKVTPGVTGFI